ncbi:MAG: polysaccharide biosynthesis tyrosine autokinase [Bacteroidetes bacterium]|nr:polysaccharide biosynthesis tyrosine autokinase [Bacteroidota bacterium]
MQKEDTPVSIDYNAMVKDEIYLKKIALKYLNNWYWFMISVVIFLLIAFLYNRYSPTIYTVSTSILIESKKQESPLTGTGFSEDNVFQGFGAMGVDRNINNQMVILQSRPLINRTLNELEYEVSYYSVGRIKKVERYNEAPFIVSWDVEHPQVIGTEFALQFLPNGKIQLSANDENVKIFNYQTDKLLQQLPELRFTKEVEIGELIATDYFSFRIDLNKDIDSALYTHYVFKFDSRRNLIEKYKRSLSVGFLQKETSILEVSLEEYNLYKGIEFLNTLTAAYQAYILEKKNENANRVINFINNQLQSVSDSLMESGDEKQSFQKEHQILDISLQSQQLLEQINLLDKEKVAMENKDKYYKYLRDYILNNQDIETIIAPSAMGIDDQLLNALILELNNLSMEKSSMTSVRNTEHPKLKRINAQIESARRNLLENVNNIISQSERALSDMNQRIWRFENKVKALPQTERDYITIERKYQLNNETYTFLLQKLSDAQIAKASNLSDSFIIEESRLKEIPSQVKKVRVFIAAILLGLILPVITLFVMDFFNSKITSETDVTEITNFPIIGRVFNMGKNGKDSTVVLDMPNSPAAESFRAIKSKIDFNLKVEGTPVIAITSSFAKEGKTYNAINIASTYANNKRKTILLDVDFRGSTISNIFELNPDNGLVNYLVDRAQIDEIIINSGHTYLDIIPAGPMPKNPAELLAGNQFQELVKDLKRRYECIIIDTSPIGVVADMLQFASLFDTTIIIVKKKATHRMGLKWVLNEVSQYGFKNIGIILNNIHPKDRKLGYGYGYGLYKIDQKRKRFTI